MLSGLIVRPLEDAPRLLREFRAICTEAEDELTVWAVLRKATLLPFLPPEWHGGEVPIFAACHVGEMARGEMSMGDQGEVRP